MPEIDLGKVTLGAPDYGVNDPKAEGYIKNRPCYAREETIRWGGSIEGLETVTVGDITLARISGFAPTAEGLVGRTVTMTAGGTTVDLTITADTIMEGENCRVLLYNGDTPIAAVADKAGAVSFNGTALTVPSAGIYVILEVMTQMGVTEMSGTVEVVQKLDAKFLPAGAGGGSFKVATPADASNFDPSKFQPGDVVLVIQG